jgi:branched-chain amino acid aminotransferase
MGIGFYNGHWVDGSQPVISTSNRAYRYGDGLFESIVVFNASAPLLPFHHERLLRSSEILLMQLPSYYSYDWLKGTVATLIEKNHYRNARLRLQISREDGGLYLPISNEVLLEISATELPNSSYQWSSIRADFSPYRVDTGVLANLKTTSKIQYVMSALHAVKKGANECFLFNTKGTLAEAINSNVFLIKDDKIITPVLTAGGVNGVMRRYLINLLELEYDLQQREVSMEDIDEADEIFLTNAIKGIQSVAVVGEVVYTDRVTRAIFAKLISVNS